MKKLLYLGIVLMFASCGDSAPVPAESDASTVNANGREVSTINESESTKPTVKGLTSIPDANFEQALINLGLDNVIDGGVLTASIDTVTRLGLESANISDLTGIEDFVALIYLFCGSNQLTSLDVSQNTALEYLTCTGSNLTSLVVTGASALHTLRCTGNELTNLDVSQNTALEYLYSQKNDLTSIDVTGATALKGLFLKNNRLTSIDVSQNTALTHLFSSGNNFYTRNIDLSQNTALKEFN